MNYYGVDKVDKNLKYNILIELIVSIWASTNRNHFHFYLILDEKSHEKTFRTFFLNSVYQPLSDEIFDKKKIYHLP